MPKLTPEHIATEERRSAEHYDDLAAKARKAGDLVSAAESDALADLCRKQADRAGRFTSCRQSNICSK